ncbi:MAG: hypothetical protein WBW79_16175 [Desulfocapsaceae bacterium]
MSEPYRVLATGFHQLALEITCNNREAASLAEFLFGDFPGGADAVQVKQYDIVCAGLQPKLSLWEGEKRLYFGTSSYQLAYTLMNEVIYHCIDTDKSRHALHAGGVSRNGICILLPGTSGSGKSSLSAWLTAHGYHYLSDELVFLSDDGTIWPLTRPISLKIDASHFPWLPSEDDCSQAHAIISSQGSMIPHRMLNPHYQTDRKTVTHFVFPQYKPGARTELLQISPAKSCLYLMQSHANARSLGGLGVAELSKIVRKCQSYTLTYGSFAELEPIFFSTHPLSC